MFALLHIFVSRRFFSASGSRFVGRNPTHAKPKIQGFAPTDKPPAVRLTSARGENMGKMIFTVLAIPFLWFRQLLDSKSNLSVAVAKSQRAASRRKEPLTQATIS
jgi:hypothetical protein